MKTVSLILAFAGLGLLPLHIFGKISSVHSRLYSPSAKKYALPKRYPATLNSIDTISKGKRDYGSFVVQYAVTNAGYQMNVKLILAGELVGLNTLTTPAPLYQFNTISNKNKAYGTLTTLFYPPGQVSALEGDFFVITERSDTIRFKGTVTGWYTTAQTAPGN